MTQDSVLTAVSTTRTRHDSLQPPINQSPCSSRHLQERTVSLASRLYSKVCRIFLAKLSHFHHRDAAVR